MSHSSSSTLQDLPHELLEQIISHFSTAQSLRSLCLVSKRLNEYIRNDGFRAFVHHRFPSISTPPHWADAAHALTTLFRAWDHKALVAYHIKPNPSQSRKADYGPGGTRRPQTMGYQPVIDCFESWTGDNWSSRKEILACGTGADLTVRFKQKGFEAERRWRKMRRYQRYPSGFDGHHHQIEWSVLKETELFDGRDDITSVNLLRDHQKPSSQSEYVVVGRASGGLSTISITQSQTPIKWGKENRFETNGSSVKFATINLSQEPLLAACLGNETICLYQVASTTEPTKSFGEAAVEKPTPFARIRSTKFLRQDLLAVGLGPCAESVQIFNIRPDSVPKLPLRKFSAGDKARRPNGQGQAGNIYSIAPLASSFLAGGAEGDLFLSGGYDGAVRLHDIRSPANYTAKYTDPVDTLSPVYSLLAIGRERFVAGGANHCLVKVFDLRMPGGKMYYAADLEPCALDASLVDRRAAELSVASACCDYHLRKAQPSSWNIFLNSPETANIRTKATREKLGSPVYSLSSPSPCSPTFFAGIEGNVIQVDVASISDPFPDPVYKYGPRSTIQQAKDMRSKWCSNYSILNVALYEHAGGSPKLKRQAPVGEIGDGTQGWDQRWISI